MDRLSALYFHPTVKWRHALDVTEVIPHHEDRYCLYKKVQKKDSSQSLSYVSIVFLGNKSLLSSFCIYTYYHSGIYKTFWFFDNFKKKIKNLCWNIYESFYFFCPALDYIQYIIHMYLSNSRDPNSNAI